MVGNVVGLTLLTFAWMAFVWPVTLIVGALSLFLGTMGDARAPAGPRRSTTSPEQQRATWRLLAPSGFTVLNLLWGGIFLTPLQHLPGGTPWYAYAIGVFLVVEVAVAFVIFLDRRRPARLAAAALLPQLWIGVVAAFLAAWAVTSGGTLGAL